MKKTVAGTSPVTTPRNVLDQALLQRLQIFDEVCLLLIAQAKLEHRIIMIDHGEQRAGPINGIDGPLE